MFNKLFSCVAVALLAGLLAAAAAPGPGATASPGTNSAAVLARPKQQSGPFHGRLKSVDFASRSFVMGTRTFYVNDKTYIVKAGKPAALKDAVVGETVSGAFRAMQDGKLMCMTLRFGPKVEGDMVRTEKRSAAAGESPNPRKSPTPGS